MSEEVGSGHISIEPQLDEAAAQRFNERLAAAIRNVNINADVDETGLNRFIAKVQSLRLTINVNVDVDESGLNRYITRVDSLRQTIKINTEVDDTPLRRFEEQVIRIPRKIHIDSEVDKGPVERFMAETKALQPKIVVDVSYDRDRFLNGVRSLVSRVGGLFRNDEGNAIGGGFFSSLSRAFDSLVSVLPGRMENLFSSAGPVGLAIAGGLLAIIGAALPAMGAMISGMLIAAFGLAGVAAGIVLALKDQRVKNAFKDFGKDFMEAIKPGEEMFIQKLLPAIEKMSRAVTSWGPMINQMLAASSKFIGPLTDGLIAFVNGFIGPLTKIMNSSFMMDLINVVSKGLGELGRAVGSVFDSFLKNPEAQKGAVMGLQTAFHLLSGSITLVGQVLAALSATWFKWSKDPDGPGPLHSKLDILGNTLKVLGVVLLASAGAIIFWASMFLWAASTAEKFVHWCTVEFPKLFKNMKNWFDDAMRFVKNLWDTTWGWVKHHAESIWNAIWQFFAHVLTNIKNWFTDTMRGIKGSWDNTWGAVKSFFTGVWNGIVSFIGSSWQNIKNWFNDGLNSIKNLWNTSWAAIKSFFEGLWQGVVSTVNNGWATIKNLFNTGVQFVQNLWNTMWQAIGDFIASIWDNITNLISNAWNTIKNLFQDGLNFVGNLWSTAWQGIYDFLSQAWQAMLDLLGNAWQAILNLFHEALTAVMNIWNSAWNSIKDFLNEIWNAMVNFLQDMWESIKSLFNDALNAIKSIWEDVWNAISDFLSSIWEKMKQLVQDAFNFLKNLVTSAMEEIHKAWEDAWNGIEGILGGIWGKIKSAVAEGMNSVIGIINGAINGINGVLSKIGVSVHIDNIPTVSAATGGYISGPGTGTSDSINARLSNGEYVIKADSVAKIGIDKLNEMNERGDIALKGPGGDAGGVRVAKGPNGMPTGAFADGGDVGAVIKATQDWLHAQAGKPYVMGAAGPDAWDCSGLVGGALKMVNGQNPNGRIFSTVDEGSHFQDGFGGENDLNVGYVGGAGGDGHTVGSIGGLNFEATPPHVLIGNVNMTPGDPYFTHKGHAVVGGGVGFTGGGSGGGGGGGGLGEFLSQGTSALMSSLVSPLISAAKSQMPQTVQGGIGMGTMDMLAEGVSKLITKAIASKGGPSDGSASSGGGGGGGGGSNSGSPGDTEVEKQAYEMAKSMNASAKVMLALFEAGFVESGFKNLQTATDHDSLGFLQQRPSAGWPDPLNIGTATRSFVSRAMAKEGGGGSAGQLAQAVQVSAFPGRYDQEEGRARAALKSLGAEGFYGGGLVGGPPGIDNLLARLSPGERVLTPAQDKAYQNGQTINVYIDGVKVAHEAVVEQNNASLIRDLKRGVGV